MTSSEYIESIDFEHLRRELVLHTLLKGEHDFECFGGPSAISKDGNVIVVGAPYYNGDSGVECGRIAIYARQSDGSYALVPGGSIEGIQAGEMFGAEVDVSGDGSFVIVSAFDHSDDGIKGCGRVAIYRRQIDGSYKLTPNKSLKGQQSGESFGSAVAISDDGQIIAIGALGYDNDTLIDCGRVSIYWRNADCSYSLLDTSIEGSQSCEWLGRAVDISGDGNVVVAGAFFYDGEAGFTSGRIVIYSRQTDGSYAPIANESIEGSHGAEWFGGSVAISGDGGTIVVGAHHHCNKSINNCGRIAIYTRQSDGSYELAPGGDIRGIQEDEFFGLPVAVSDDGGIVVAGATDYDGVVGGEDCGRIAAFRRKEDGSYALMLGGDIEGSQEESYFGCSVSIASDDSLVLVGAYQHDNEVGLNCGRVLLYKLE